MVGKWHVGFSTIGHKPLARGFDSFYGYLTGKINYWTKASDYDGYLDLYEGNQLVTNEGEISSDKHTTFLLQEKVEAIIKLHAQQQNTASVSGLSSSSVVNNYKPMFLYYALQMIHSSVSAPDSYVQRCTSATAPITATTGTRKTTAVGSGNSAAGSGNIAAGNGGGNGGGGNNNGNGAAVATSNSNSGSSSSSGDDDGGNDYVYQQNYCATNLMLDEAIANLTCTLNQYGFGKILIAVTELWSKFHRFKQSYLNPVNTVMYTYSYPTPQWISTGDNTILIIASDNGGDKTGVGSSYPFKGQKGSAWNGGVAATALIHSKLLPEGTK